MSEYSPAQLAEVLRLPRWTDRYPDVVAHAAVNLVYRARVVSATHYDEQQRLIRDATWYARRQRR
jgi:hypothetical protein